MSTNPVKIPPVNPEWKLSDKAKSAYETLRTIGDLQSCVLSGNFPGAAAHRAIAMMDWLEPHIAKAEKEWEAHAPKQPAEPEVTLERVA